MAQKVPPQPTGAQDATFGAQHGHLDGTLETDLAQNTFVKRTTSEQTQEQTQKQMDLDQFSVFSKGYYTRITQLGASETIFTIIYSKEIMI